MTESLSNVDLSDLNSIKYYIHEGSRSREINSKKMAEVLVALCFSRDTAMVEKVTEMTKVEGSIYHETVKEFNSVMSSAIVQAAIHNRNKAMLRLL